MNKSLLYLLLDAGLKLDQIKELKIMLLKEGHIMISKKLERELNKASIFD